VRITFLYRLFAQRAYANGSRVRKDITRFFVIFI